MNELHVELKDSGVLEQDDRFAAAEAEVDRGEPWLYRELASPNPLTIVASDWSSGHTKLGPAEFLHGTDRAGRKWSILVGGLVLRKRLIEGLVERWDTERNAFVVTETLGRVQPGEVVSIHYLGDRQGTQFTYPDFRVSRKAAGAELNGSEEAGPAPAAEREDDDGIPF